RFDDILQLVLGAESDQAYLNVVNGSGDSFELTNQAQDVRIDIIGASRVEQNTAAARRLAQSIFQGGSIQKADLVGEFDVQHLASEMLFPNPANRPTQVAV